MGTSQRDPLGILSKPAAPAGSDPLGILKKKDGTQDAITASQDGSVTSSARDRDQEVLDRLNKAYEKVSTYAEQNIHAVSMLPGQFQAMQDRQAGRLPTDNTGRAVPPELSQMKAAEQSANPAFGQYVQQKQVDVKKDLLEGNGEKLKFFIQDEKKKTDRKLEELRGRMNQIQSATRTVGMGKGGSTRMTNRPFTPEEKAEMDLVVGSIKAEEEKQRDFLDATELVTATQQLKNLNARGITDMPTKIKEMDRAVRKVMGDRTALQEEANDKRGEKLFGGLRAETRARNSQNGIRLLADALAVEKARVNKTPESERDPELVSKIDQEVKALDAAAKNQIKEHPEYYVKQLGKLVADRWVAKRSSWGEVFNSKPSDEQAKKMAFEIGLEYGLSEEEAKLLSDKMDVSGDLPLTSALGRGLHGLAQGAFGLSNFARRVAMSAGGSSSMAIDYINDQATAEYERDFERASAKNLFSPTTRVGERLMEERNPNGGKLQLSTSNVIATMADTFGQITDAAYSGRAFGSVFQKLAGLSSKGTSALAKHFGLADDAAGATTAIRSAEQIEKTRNMVGMFAQTAAATYDQNLRDAHRATGNSAAAQLYAVLKTAATAGTELINLDIKWAPRIFERMSPQALIREVSQQGMKNFMTVDGVKKFVKNVGGDVLKEVTEEELDLMSEFMLSQMLIPENVEGRNFWDEAKETAITTAIGTVLPMGLSHMRSRGAAYKNMMYEVGSRPTTHLEQIDDEVAAGRLDQQTANERKQVINTLSQAVQLSEHSQDGNKQDYVFNYLRKALATKDKERVKSDPELMAEVDRQLKEDLIAARKSEEEINRKRAEAEAEGKDPDLIPEEPVVVENPDEREPLDLSSLIETTGSAAQEFEAAQPTTLGGRVLSAYDLDENNLDPSGEYTVIVPQAMGGLASFVGADVKPVGENDIQVTIRGHQLHDLITKENEQNGRESQQEAGNKNAAGNRRNEAEERGTSQEAAQTTGTDRGNSVQRDPAQEEGSSPQEVGANPALPSLSPAVPMPVTPRPFVQMPTARRGAGTPNVAVQMPRNDMEQTTRNGVTVIAPAQTQVVNRGAVAVQMPRVTMGPNNTLTLVPNEQNTPNQVRPQEQSAPAEQREPGTQNIESPSPAESGLEGVYQFTGQIEAPINDLHESETIRKGKPLVTSLREFMARPNRKPALAWRRDDGRIIILDGRARIAAAKSRGETTFPIRLLRGDMDMARQVAELSREMPSRKMAQVRADKIQNRTPESFREFVLQAMLSALRAGGRPLINLASFKQFVAMNRSNNPYRLGYGKTNKDYNQLIRTGIVGDNEGPNMDEFVMDYLDNYNDTLDEQTLTNEAIEIMTTLMDKESILAELEFIQGVDTGGPAQASLLPMRMTEEEAVYVASHKINNILEDVVFGADQMQLTQEEADFYDAAVRRNADPQAMTIDEEGLYNDIFNNDLPVARSLADKITLYATTTEEAHRQSTRNTGGETILGDTQDENTDDEAAAAFDPDYVPFSRANAAAGIVKLTARQARRVTKALSRAFGGSMKFTIDRRDFERAFRRIAKASKLPLEMQGLIADMQRAQDVLAAAERAFNNKRKELDATIRSETTDLFGNRPVDATNRMFDNTLDTGAREEAIKPFRDRLQKAQREVNKIQKKIDTLEGGTMQGVMFNKNGQIAGFYLASENKVYLNPDVVRADTPIHEIGGHALAKWARQNNPQLFQKMLAAANEAPQDMIDYVRTHYADQFLDAEGNIKTDKVDDFWEEVFATAMGWDKRNVARTIETAEETRGWKSFRDTIKELWNDFIDFLYVNNLIPSFAKGYITMALDDNYEDMSLSDFTNMLGEKMFSGRRLSAPIGLPNYRAMGADLSLLQDQDFLYDIYGNIIGVQPDVLQQIGMEKAAIKRSAINNGNYMLAPDGTPTTLTEDQWLTTQTIRFQEWDKGRSLGGILTLIKNMEWNKGPMGDMMRLSSVSLERQQQTLRFLIDQMRDAPGALLDAVGEQLFEAVARWSDLPGQALRTPNGDPAVMQHIAAEQLDNGLDTVIVNNYNALRTRNTGGGAVTPVFVRAGKVLNADTPEGTAAINRALAVSEDNYLEVLRQQGYDAVYENGGRIVAVLNPQGNIKSAMSNTTFSDESNDLRFQRIGERARLTTQQREALETAQTLEKYSRDPERIFLVTGWYRGVGDNKWRFELPNVGVRFIPPSPGTIKPTGETQMFLGQLLDYPALYAAYPQLRTLPVLFSDLPPGIAGAYYRELGLVRLSKNMALGRIYTVLRHEVQHAVQHMEGFEQGANLDIAEQYYNRKLEHTKTKLANFRKEQERQERLQVRAVMEQKPIEPYAQQIEYLERQIAQAAAIIEQMQENKEWLVQTFYESFAGEDEAYGIEERSKLTEEVRMATMPDLIAANQAITYSDNLALRLLPVEQISTDRIPSPFKPGSPSDVEFERVMRTIHNKPIAPALQALLNYFYDNVGGVSRFDRNALTKLNQYFGHIPELQEVLSTINTVVNVANENYEAAEGVLDKAIPHSPEWRKALDVAFKGVFDVRKLNEQLMEKFVNGVKAITGYTDQMQKDFAAYKAYERWGMLRNTTAESRDFTPDGHYKGDAAAVSASNVSVAFSVVPADADENIEFNRGLTIWKGILELTTAAGRSQRMDKKVFLTSREFLRLFGAQNFQQIPAQVRPVIDAIWNMNERQQELLLQAVNDALASKRKDRKAAWKASFKKIQEEMAAEQPLKSQKKEPTVDPSDRPETFVPSASMTQDIANGLSDEEIIATREFEMGKPMDAASRRRFLANLERTREEYETFSREVQAEIRRLHQTSDGRAIKQMHKRFLKSPFRNTVAFQNLSDEIATYERVSRNDMATRARELADLDVELALNELRREANNNSAFAPALAAAIMEKLNNPKSGPELRMAEEAMAIMYDYSNSAGTNLNMVSLFYQMLGMSNAAGKINFFIRVKNRMDKDARARAMIEFRDTDSFNAVKEVQEQALKDLANKSTDDKFVKRIENLIKNLKDC